MLRVIWPFAHSRFDFIYVLHLRRSYSLCDLQTVTSLSKSKGKVKEYLNLIF